MEAPARRGLYTRLASAGIFPLHERIKGHTSVALRRALEESQWWPTAKIRALQAERLRDFLRHIGANVPYYAAIFAERGFDPSQVMDADALRKLPLLDKPLIRANMEALKSRGARDLRQFSTGGSSGEPLRFFIGKNRVSHDVAAKWRATRWWGVDIGDREVVVWGSPIEVGAQDRMRMLRDRLLRTRLLPAFEMSDAKLEEFVGRIRALKPKMLFGYPSALSLIARYAERRQIRMDDLGIAVAFVTSERLYDDQRRAIAKAFGCRVANGYGGRDAGFVAHECPAGSMHITAEDIVVELLDRAGQPVKEGETGEIVVTHLATQDFPFVRYRTGDVGRLATTPCACGRGLPAFADIKGRSTDFVVAADGTVMHGLALIYVLREMSGIRQFQIVQESRRLTRVRLVADSTAAGDMPARIRDGFRARLGADVDVEIEFVDAIAPEGSGKFRYVKSLVVEAHA